MPSIDTETLPATWQEALENHTISNAKAFEKQLRTSALRDKEKLRVLVGSNYRDLLSTAEQIVELNDQNRRAETSISALSQACKPPSDLIKDPARSSTAIVASHVKLMDRLLRCASKAVNEKSVLVAGKMIVTARLLLKHLEQEYGSSKTVLWLTARLKIGRQQLLGCIDVIFIKPTTPLIRLIQAAGAYCLTTSSTSADASRHFRTLRIQRLAKSLTGNEPTRSQLKADLRQRCQYFIASIIAIKALSGRAVTDLLNNLQKNPILEDQNLLAIETLQLDSIRTLLPDDILSFTPYFKRATAVPSELRASLQQWVNETSKHLLKHIETTIQDASLQSVLKTRQVTLDILLPSCFSSLSHELITTSIREIFSARITLLIQQQAQTLHSLATSIPTIIESTQLPNETIWQSDLPRKLTAQPAPSCLREIRRSHLGIPDTLSTYLDKLRVWLMERRRTKQQVEALSKIRWQDKIEEPDEDDEEVARALISALSKDDPATYLETFEEAANAAADVFMATIAELATQLATSTSASQSSSTAADTIDTSTDHTIDTPNNITSPIPTLVRITREATHTLESLLPAKSLTPLHSATQTLHTTLSTRTLTTLFTTLDSKVSSSPNPPFIPPDLPSASTTLLLHTLCTILSATGGTDIWTAPAISKLKRMVLQAVMEGDKKERYVRSEMDDAYLRVALGDGGENGVDGVSDIQRRAAVYWSRSRLLFGVLNP